jgi:hypothetical protein
MNHSCIASDSRNWTTLQSAVRHFSCNQVTRVARKSRLVLATVALGVAGLSQSSHAQIVTGYTLFAPGETGSYTYFDDTGRQLLDGVTGSNSILATSVLGRPAYDWIGWRAASQGGANFTFDGRTDPLTTVQIETISIGFNRTQSAGIFLPTTVRVGDSFFPAGQSFAVSPTAIPDQTRGFLDFDVSALGITGNFYVSLVDGDTNHWIFVDEVRFTYSTVTTTPPTGSSAVPEPSTYGLIGAGTLFALVAWRRRRTKKGATSLTSA